MAFSKAKLLRFNDIKSCVPPPGAYNPKYDEHVSGAVTYTKDRAPEPCSPASSCCEARSHSSIPSFRTPTIPRRKKTVVLPNSAGRTYTGAKLFSPHRSEALRDKIVECVNKDETIRELEGQLEELKLALSTLRVEKTELAAHGDALLQQLQTVQDEYEASLHQLREQHGASVAAVDAELAQCRLATDTVREEFAAVRAQHVEQMRRVHQALGTLDEQLARNQHATELVLHETSARLADKESRYAALEHELAAKCGQLQQLEASVRAHADLQTDHEHHMARVHEAHGLELQQLEYELLQVATHWQQAAAHSRSWHAAEVQRVRADCAELRAQTEAHVRQSEENCTERLALADIQMEAQRAQLELDWRAKLQEQAAKAEEVLSECQAIGEYSVVQGELEKNEVRRALADAEHALDTVRAEQQQLAAENVVLAQTAAELRTDMSRLIVELNAVREQLGGDVAAGQRQLRHVQVQLHSYEVALDKTHATVNALKTRLLDSDRDVEQLKAELEGGEAARLRGEARCNELVAELQCTRTANHELSAHNESLRLAAEHQVAETEARLLQRIDAFKATADSERATLHSLVAEKQRGLDEVHAYLRDEQRLQRESQAAVSGARVEIERLESENTELQFKVARLQRLAAAQDELRAQLAAKDTLLAQSVASVRELQQARAQSETDATEMAAIYRKYIEQSGKFDDLQHRYEALVARNQGLERTIDEQNALIGPFREQLENFERDRQMLVAHKHEAEKEAKEMGLKYAEILGHQNYKQKLRHIVDLKKKNIELTESKHECESRILQQSRQIEKLKQEVHKLSRRSRSMLPTDTANKENHCSSPGKTPGRLDRTPSRLDSPGNPLKERN